TCLNHCHYCQLIGGDAVIVIVIVIEPVFGTKLNQYITDYNQPSKSTS
ncbi:MAG: hypothetical protein ACI8RD_000347, partial [Bacillariaceae sp.]